MVVMELENQVAEEDTNADDVKITNFGALVAEQTGKSQRQLLQNNEQFPAYSPSNVNEYLQEIPVPLLKTGATWYEKMTPQGDQVFGYTDRQQQH